MNWETFHKFQCHTLFCNEKMHRINILLMICSLNTTSIHCCTLMYRTAYVIVILPWCQVVLNFYSLNKKCFCFSSCIIGGSCTLSGTFSLVSPIPGMFEPSHCTGQNKPFACSNWCYIGNWAHRTWQLVILIMALDYFSHDDWSHQSWQLVTSILPIGYFNSGYLSL